MNRREFVAGLGSAALLADCSFRKGFAPTAAPSAGLVQLNVVDTSPQMTINAFNSVVRLGFSSGATPACLDEYNYPVRNFSGSINLGFLVNDPILTTGPWVLTWPSTRSAFAIQLAVATANVTINSSSNCSFDTSTGGYIFTPTSIGTSGFVNFTLAASTKFMPSFAFIGINTGSFSYSNWNSSSNTSGTIALVRASDMSAYNAGQYWTPEFISLVSNLSPRSLRHMGWNLWRGSTDSNESLWAYRATPSKFSWFFTPSFPPTAWAGGAGAAGTITKDSNDNYSCAAATDTVSNTWNPGEVIMGKPSASSSLLMSVTGTASNAGLIQLTVSGVSVTSAMTAGQRVWVGGVNGTTEANGLWYVHSLDSSTQFSLANSTWSNAWTSGGTVGYQKLTVTGAGTKPSKLILSDLGRVIASGWGAATDQINIVTTTTAAVFVYDQVLDCLLYTDGGISTTPPVEALVQLANACNARLWFNLPPWATDGYVTSLLNTVYPILNSVLELELSNEMWNALFPQYYWAGARGNVLGITTPISGSPLPYQSLALRHIMGTVVPSSSYSANMSKINRLYMHQAGANLTSSFGRFGNGMFEGSALPSTSGAANAAYLSYIGGTFVNYTASPNRPIDVCDSIGMAPYLGGLWNQGGAIGGIDPANGNFSPASDAVAKWQSIIDNYNNGNLSAAFRTITTGFEDGITYTATVDTTATSGTTIASTTALPSSVYFGGTQGTFIEFFVTGGPGYSGIDYTAGYWITSTPSSTTFTCQKLVNGFPSGGNINVGTNGGGTTTFGQTSSSSCFTNEVNYCMLEEGMCGFYDVQRASAGIAKLKWQMYEGGPALTIPDYAAGNGTFTNITSPSGSTGATFTGSISGTTLTASGVSGTIATGQTLIGLGVAPGTNITAGSGTSWTVNNSQSVSGSMISVTATSSSDCTTLGLLSPNPGGTALAAAQIIRAASDAWKNSASAKSTILNYFHRCFGTQPGTFSYGKMSHVGGGSILVISGGVGDPGGTSWNPNGPIGGEYSLCAADDPANPQPYQLYYGVQALNQGSEMALALDGSVEANASGTVTATLATSNPNDVIVVDLLSNGGPISSVTASAPGLSSFALHRRVALSGNPANTVERWWATASLPLSSVTITVRPNRAAFTAVIAYGVSGANTSSPWDAGGPQTSNASPSDPISITTVNADTMVVAVFRQGIVQNPTAGSGFTVTHPSTHFLLSEYQILTSAQTISCTDGSAGDTNAGIADAIAAAGAAPSTLDVQAMNRGSEMALALDGSVEANASGTVTATLTTSNSNDVIVVDILSNGGPISSVTASAPGLSSFALHQKVALSGNPADTVERWWATASQPLSSVTITVRPNRAAFTAVIAYGVSGANTSSPWDAGGPQTSNASPSDPISITTVNANTMVVAVFRQGIVQNPTAGSGFTETHPSTHFLLSEYQILTSAQTISCTDGSAGDTNAGIADAIVAAGAAPSTLR